MDETQTDHNEYVSTGLPGLDQVLDGLRSGDNVVWRVHDLDEYRRYIPPFVAAAAAARRRIIYLRWGQHAPLINNNGQVVTVTMSAADGFEAFTSQVWRQIQEHGRGAFYICDSLSDLLNAWATDTMLGNFFRVICPQLYLLDTVAWFAIDPARHSPLTLDRIRHTTQVLIDAYSVDNTAYLQPIKVWRRASPTLFLPHAVHVPEARDHPWQFTPVTDSRQAARLQARVESASLSRQPVLDYWDTLFDRLQQGGEAVRHQVMKVLITREPRMLALAQRYLDVTDLLAIRRQMIGSGYIGGKATGMLLARKILLQHNSDYWGQCLQEHDSFFLGTDAYYAFVVHNGLWPALMRQRVLEGDDTTRFLQEAPALRAGFKQGDFPAEIRAGLQRVLDHFGQYPLLVRSSSLQEDGFGNAFAGKYDSVFLANQGAPEQRLAALEDAIRQVYASTMSEDALTYRLRRGLHLDEEPMALLLQRVNGRFHKALYFPDAAGVAVSRNTFAWDKDMNPEAGMVRLVMGLGTRAVDRIEGDHAAVLALDWPERRPFRSNDEYFAMTQHMLDAIDVEQGKLVSESAQRLFSQLPDLPLAQLAEQDHRASERARALNLQYPVWRLTFKPLIRSSDFIERMQHLLRELERAYEHPVDVEFTLQFTQHSTFSLAVVQCRPLATLGSPVAVQMPDTVPARHLLLSQHGHFMGGNMDLTLNRVVRIDATAYARVEHNRRYNIAQQLGTLLRNQPADRKTLLIGPGRWGTASPELGVPVRFADIAGIRALAEVAEPASNMMPDLSYGSHFFQDLVESNIAYIAIFPDAAEVTYAPQHLPEPVEILADGVICVYDLDTQPLNVQADVVTQRVLAFLQH